MKNVKERKMVMINEVNEWIFKDGWVSEEIKELIK